MKNITNAILTIGILAFCCSCQRCYTCKGELSSYYLDPFTGEIVETYVPDEQSFCGTGIAGTRDVLATFEKNGYDCIRTD